eukprot:Pgem_evm1s20004
MDFAAENGHLDVVKFLHRNRTEGCTKNAMTKAVKNGHLEVVKFLHKHRTEGCSPKAFQFARDYGHKEIFEFLKYNVPTTASVLKMDSNELLQFSVVLGLASVPKEQEQEYTALEQEKMREGLLKFITHQHQSLKMSNIMKMQKEQAKMQEELRRNQDLITKEIESLIRSGVSVDYKLPALEFEA